MSAESSGDQQKKKLPRGKPFQKGQSGNPGGLPKGLAEMQALARTYTLEAFQGLADLARGAESEMVRKAAWDSLLDRGWGKATMKIDLNQTENLTDAQLDQRIAEGLAAFFAEFNAGRPAQVDPRPDDAAGSPVVPVVRH